MLNANYNNKHICSLDIRNIYRKTYIFKFIFLYDNINIMVEIVYYELFVDINNR